MEKSSGTFGTQLTNLLLAMPSLASWKAPARLSFMIFLTMDTMEWGCSKREVGKYKVDNFGAVQMPGR